MVVNTKSVKLPIPFTTFTHVLGSGLHSTNGDIARSILYISVKTDGLNMGAANFVILASAPNVFEVNERTSFTLLPKSLQYHKLPLQPSLPALLL